MKEATVLTIDPADSHSLEDSDEEEREATHTVVHEVEEVDTSVCHHGDPQQESHEDHRRPGEKKGKNVFLGEPKEKF